MGRLARALSRGQRFVLSGPYGTEVAERLARDTFERPQKIVGVSVNPHIGAGCSALLTPQGKIYLHEVASDYIGSTSRGQNLVVVTPTFRLAKQTLEAAAKVRGWDPRLPALGLELCLDALQVAGDAISNSSRERRNTLIAMSVGPPFECYQGEKTPRDVDGKYLPQVFAAVRFGNPFAYHTLDYLMFETVPSLKAAKGAARAFARAHQELDIDASKANFENMGTIEYIDSLLSRARFFGPAAPVDIAPSYDRETGKFPKIDPVIDYVISFCLDKDGKVTDGPPRNLQPPRQIPLNDAIEQMYETIEKESLVPPAGIGINCNSPRVTEMALASLSPENARRVIGIHPNASSVDDPREYSHMTHQQAIPVEKFVEAVARMTAQYNLKIIGGCCGTNPETMKELGKILAN